MSTTLILLLTVFIAVLTTGFSLYFFLRNRKIHHQNEVLQTQLKEFNNQIRPLQLEVLEAKLNPHLFKNILNSIQSHAYQTYFAIDKLSNVLDYILYESRKEFVSPKEEIAFALNLVEINKIKVSPLFDLKIKTKIKEDMEPLYEQRLLAPLVSIDLIENAFKHADIQSPNAFISITLEFTNNQFILTVANTISTEPTLKKEKSGLGLKTLEKRLKIIYENDFELVNHIENNVYFAQLKINLFEHKIKMLAIR
jgi:LytS/YehU family sensor histidine kinase